MESSVRSVDCIAKYNGAHIYVELATRVIYLDAEDVKLMTGFNPTVSVPRSSIPLFCAAEDKYIAGFNVDTLVASIGSVSSLGQLCKQFGLHAMAHMSGIYVIAVDSAKNQPFYAYGCHCGEKSVEKIVAVIKATPGMKILSVTTILAGNHSVEAIDRLVRKNIDRLTVVNIPGLSGGIINFSSVDPRIADIFNI